MQWLKYALSAILALALYNPAQAAPVDPSQLDILKLPEWSATSKDYGGKLLLSDSPETVLEDGIMYQDTVSGDVRLFFHHVNGTKEPKKITVMLENPGDEAVDVTVYRYGLAGPGLDYLVVGKAAQVNYFTNQDIYLVEIPAHSQVPLSDPLENMVVQPDMLVNGIFDMQADKPFTVKTVMMPVGANSKKFTAQAKILPADQYKLRGTFEGHDRMVIPNNVYNAKDHGPAVITLGDNQIDPYIWGVDATDGSKVQNFGNYGLVYRLWLPSDATGKVSYYLNPRGGVYAGAIGIKYQHDNKPPAETPPDCVAFGIDKLTDFASIGDYDSGQSLWLTFSPPGASNLPVKLVVLPRQ